MARLRRNNRTKPKPLRKRPSARSSSLGSKEVRAQDIDAPDRWRDERPTWRLSLLDTGGPFCWMVRTDPRKLQSRLKAFESRLWREILQDKSNHAIPVARLSKAARDRIEELRLPTDVLYQLRVEGSKRVWGIRQESALALLWWDPDHQVYPMDIKN